MKIIDLEFEMRKLNQALDFAEKIEGWAVKGRVIRINEIPSYHAVFTCYNKDKGKFSTDTELDFIDSLPNYSLISDIAIKAFKEEIGIAHEIL